MQLSSLLLIQRNTQSLLLGDRPDPLTAACLPGLVCTTSSHTLIMQCSVSGDSCNPQAMFLPVSLIHYVLHAMPDWTDSVSAAVQVSKSVS